MTALLPALAGANLIYGAGMIESGVTFDFGQLVMDNEFAKMIKQCVGGIPIDDESLLIEDIQKVGSSGDFLSLESTLRFMHGQSQPRLLDRRVREDWETAGSSDLYERALTEARRLLATHEPEPLPEPIREEIRGIVEQADAMAGASVR